MAMSDSRSRAKTQVNVAACVAACVSVQSMSAAARGCAGAEQDPLVLHRRLARSARLEEKIEVSSSSYNVIEDDQRWEGRGPGQCCEPGRPVV